MYIAPNSEIYLLQNVPIHGEYEHTLWFNDAGEQAAYFLSATKVIAHLTNYSYLRYKENWISVELPIEQLTFCNYMVFRNTSFENKYFYAFVTDIEYVNNKTTKIYYELDVMQTWLFEAKLSTCFIEREHTATDVAGDNLIPENFETGEYVYQEIKPVSGEADPWKGWLIFIGSTVEYDGSAYVDVQGDVYQGLYSGVKWIPFETATDANAFIEGLTDDQKSNAIVGIVMLPEFCAYNDNGTWKAKTYLPYIDNSFGVTYFPMGDGGGYPENYMPTNKKLCTAPYTQLLVTDYAGHSASYPYEYFNRNDDGTISFKTIGAVSAVPQFATQPLGFKGLGIAGTQAQDSILQALTTSDIPQCAFTIDSYRAWLAMASTKVGVATDVVGGLTKVVAGVAGATASLATFDGSGLSTSATTAISGMAQIASTMASFYDHSMQPPQAKSIGGGSVVFQSGTYGFHYLQCYIRYEYARMIDHYFTMYGYRVNQVKMANVFTSYKRPKFNYIKTIGARIRGSVPVDDERKICSIYDKGITFWDDPARVGDYSQDNSPVV